jgi:hypothetical protein
VVHKSLANLVPMPDNSLIIKSQLDAQNSKPSTRGAECQMRKTVHEWLGANKNGIGPAKKKSATPKQPKRQPTKTKIDRTPSLTPRKKRKSRPK